jgi:hypothetical protein
MKIVPPAPMSTSIQEDLSVRLQTDPELRERIARRAYEIYETEGRQSGRELEHWCQAENEVLRLLKDANEASNDSRTIQNTLAVNSEPKKRSKSAIAKGVGIRPSL